MPPLRLAYILFGTWIRIDDSTMASIEDPSKEEFTQKKNPELEVYADNAGKARFRLKARSGEIIAVEQAYKSLAS